MSAPATDAMLAIVWPLWHALPHSMLPEERAWILSGLPVASNATHRAHLARLVKKFPKTKPPLDRQTFGPALAAATQWAKLLRYVDSTFRLHQSLVERQLNYSTLDDMNTGRVAIYRTARELAITRPGFLQRTSPTVAQVDYLQNRYAAYLQARTDATHLLHPLIFVPRLHSKRKLSFEAQPVGLPHPPANFPRHVYLARLAGLGICSPARLEQFMATEFLKLSRAEKDEFCDEYHRPTKPRHGIYAILWVWLADNAPLFNAFNSTWTDILKLAKQRFNPKAPDGYRDCPASAGNLKMGWRDVERNYLKGRARRITPPSGRPNINRQSHPLPAELLTPLPAISLPAKV